MEGLTRKLVVKIINGRGLKNKETFQTSDPYCLVEVGDQKHKTKHISSNLNPDWGEEFIFDLPKDGLYVLSLSVWDKNTIKKDVFMGYTFVTFDDCKTMTETTKTVNMMGGLSGQITLSLIPEFETSASKIERLDKVVIENKHDDSKLKKEISDLNEKITQLAQKNGKLTKENEDLVHKCGESKKSDSKDEALAKLRQECINLKKEKDSEIMILKNTITNLQSQLLNYSNVFDELMKENLKLLTIRDGLNNLFIK